MFAIGLLLTMSWHPSFSQSSQHAAIEGEAIEVLRQQIAAWVNDGSIVGAEVLLLKRGKPVWHEAFGLRDLETGDRMRRNGIFRIRSMTKPILGTAALRLIDRGELDLEDAVGDYLTGLEGESAAITVRQLLTHTAGFEFSPFPLERSDYSSLRASVLDGAKAGPTLKQGKFNYSDLGSATLGAVLEAASGKDLESLIQVEVFEVFGMQESFTRFEPAVDWAERVNSTHWWEEDSRSHERYWSPQDTQEMPYFRASGGVYTTTADYAAFMEAWRTRRTAAGERFLSDELLTLAHEKLPDATYGMHWEVASTKDGESYLFGHGGSDGTLAITVPEEELTLLYFTQSRGQSCRNQFAMLAGMTGEFGALSELITWGNWRSLLDQGSTVPLAAIDYSLYRGIYEASGEVVVVEPIGGSLKLIRGTDSVPGDQRPDDGWQPKRLSCRHFLSVPTEAVDLIPIGPHQFQMGTVVGQKIEAVYWPESIVEFRVENNKVLGYEIEYATDAKETARAYHWELSPPSLQSKSIPNEFQNEVAGHYSAGGWGALVLFENDELILQVGDRELIFLHQGAGIFRNDDGDVLMLYKDAIGNSLALSILEASGETHKLSRTLEKTAK